MKSITVEITPAKDKIKALLDSINKIHVTDKKLHGYETPPPRKP